LPNDFTSGGSGNDFVEFLDCTGIAYGDAGNDEIRGGETGIEAHGRSGYDILWARNALPCSFIEFPCKPR